MSAVLPTCICYPLLLIHQPSAIIPTVSGNYRTAQPIVCLQYLVNLECLLLHFSEEKKSKILSTSCFTQ
eukprot:scaffold8391_cov267-Chaetoceros_neogracile.AAC.5